MQNVQNAKQRAELLESEILKIDNELFELEKKYGEFNIKKGKIESTPIKSSERKSSMKLEVAVS
jgi:predicted  nucleic acid-binding Zn-ribbon protein